VNNSKYPSTDPDALARTDDGFQKKFL